MTEKGKLIVIDGTSDGAGKKTQTERLRDRLLAEEFRVKMYDFPRYGERSATLVEDYLNGKFGKADEVGSYVPSIFYACDRFSVSAEMKAWLASGGIAVTNRYTSSNKGHQAGKIKDPEERKRFLEWLDNLEHGIFGIPRPDLNMLLTISPERGQILVDRKGHRDYVGGSKRDIHEADIQHLRDARQAYLEVAQAEGWKIIQCDPNGVLRAIDDIANEVWQTVQPILTRKS